MPKIVTLKDNNDDIVYPITPIDAVFTDTSVTLENMIDAKADTDLTNVVNGSVTTNKIANSAVTSDKIDWTTIVEDNLTLSIAGGVTRMKVVVFGKIAFINLAFTPSATGNGTICSTGNYKPRFNTELTLFTGSNGTVSRRALWNTNGTVSGDYWSADFTRVFGMAFLA